MDEDSAVEAHQKDAWDFQTIMFDPGMPPANQTRYPSASKGRVGPMSLNSRARIKAVKDAGGACWRCKFTGKGCDAKDPCSSCPLKATPWRTVGCRRGMLWDVLPRVVLNSETHGESEEMLRCLPKGVTVIALDMKLIETLASKYLPVQSTGLMSTASLMALLSASAQYQRDTADVSLS
jgi:hypothetical protein